MKSATACACAFTWSWLIAASQSVKFLQYESPDLLAGSLPMQYPIITWILRACAAAMSLSRKSAEYLPCDAGRKPLENATAVSLTTPPGAQFDSGGASVLT